MGLTASKRNLIYQKTNGICIVCGRLVIGRESLEHYIPRAIYKWVPSQEVKDLLESTENLFIVHPKCNLKKDADLPTVKSIKSLPVSCEVKNELLKLYKDTEQTIATYRAMKQSVLSSQNAKCFFCHKKISLLNATLRRLNNQQDRVPDNAMCLCFSCSVRAGNPNYKRRMVKKRLSNNNPPTT